jgi:hypothetical protein
LNIGTNLLLRLTVPLEAPRRIKTHSFYRTYLYDVILRIAGIETAREGELDDVITPNVPKVLTVLLRVHDQAAIRSGPCVLQQATRFGLFLKFWFVRLLALRPLLAYCASLE